MTTCRWRFILTEMHRGRHESVRETVRSQQPCLLQSLLGREVGVAESQEMQPFPVHQCPGRMKSEQGVRPAWAQTPS